MFVQKNDNFINLMNNGQIPNLKQIWHHPFRYSGSNAFNAIIKLVDDNIININDIKICELLLRFRFATVTQLANLVQLSETETQEILDKLLGKNLKLINCFRLSTEEPFSNSEDFDNALPIYCLDNNGKAVLEHYSEFNTLNWFQTQNMLSGMKVLKILSIVNLFQHLSDNSFRSNAQINITTDIRTEKQHLDFIFSVSDHNYIGFIIPPEHENLLISSSFKGNIQQFLTNKSYLKIFPQAKTNPQIIFLLADTTDKYLSPVIHRLINLSWPDYIKSNTEFALEQTLYFSANSIAITSNNNHTIKGFQGARQGNQIGVQHLNDFCL